MSYRGEVTIDDIRLMQSVISNEAAPGFLQAFDGGKVESVREAVETFGIIPVLSEFRTQYPFRPETFELVERFRSAPALSDRSLVRALLGGTYGVSYKAWFRAAARAERMICEIRDGDQHRGTGFLIGDDLVVTARHVFDDCREPSRVRFVFDALTLLGCTFDPGVTVSLAAVSLDRANKVLKNKALDVVVLRTDSNVGSMLLGVNPQPRSWFQLPDLTITDGQLISLVHRPRIGCYEMSPGVFNSQESSGESFLYDADSDSGSSGAPVFDLLTWDILGVHRGILIDSPFRQATTGGVVRAIIEGEEKLKLADPPVPLLG